MRVAVLSGKGGAGKSLASINLAATMAPSRYLDCDTEEPNGHLFFHAEEVTVTAVTVLLPRIDPALCTLCRACVDFCAFNALGVIGEAVHVMDNLCKSCGGCALLCPTGAISEQPRIIGGIRSFVDDGVRFDGGELIPGQETGVPVVKAVTALADDDEGWVFVDCAPGTACGVMEALMDADFCVLVAEPTRFGLHNLALAIELVQHFDKPLGVVINKDSPGNDPVGAYCAAKGIPLLGRIPFDERIARITGDGQILVRSAPDFRPLFAGIAERIAEEAVR